MALSKMSLEDFYKQHTNLNSQEIMLDVRRPDEFASGHVKGATNIPVEQLGHRYTELDKSKTYYIYCKRGGRAQTAFELLRTAGFDNLVCVYDAGMDLWKENNYPLHFL